MLASFAEANNNDIDSYWVLACRCYSRKSLTAARTHLLLLNLKYQSCCTEGILYLNATIPLVRSNAKPIALNNPMRNKVATAITNNVIPTTLVFCFMTNALIIAMIYKIIAAALY